MEEGREGTNRAEEGRSRVRERRAIECAPVSRASPITVVTPHQFGEMESGGGNGREGNNKYGKTMVNVLFSSHTITQ